VQVRFESDVRGDNRVLIATVAGSSPADRSMCRMMHVSE
jgi:hypothetical protein